ncbi:MAG: Type 1 glutamine amidotransferase-like domain-containing protein [Phycisphaeraceae bacterium]
MRSLILSILALTISSTPTLALDYYLTGSASDSNATPQPGLVLAGGGADVDSAMTWLLNRAAGGDIVVIRASGSDGYNDYFYSDLPGTQPNSVETLVFRSRTDAFNSFAIDKLQNAEAIFIAGGDQSRYDDYWRNSPIEDILNTKAANGVPIGGTSAGLAILGSTAYVAQRSSVTSTEALSNPFHRNVTLQHDFLTIPYLDDLVTDSHFTQRDREGRLATFVARILSDTNATTARGIGVDEAAALTIDASGYATFHGPTNRSATLLSVYDPDINLPPGQPLNLGPIESYTLTTGGAFRLPSWSPVGNTATTRSWSAYNHGNLINLGNLGDLNLDTLVNTADIDLLLTEPTTPGADLNLDGTVNQLDLEYLLVIVLGSSIGDANLDRKVDLADLSTLATNFGNTNAAAAGGWAAADFDGSGSVDLIDLSLLATNFGFKVAVPETTSTSLLLLALASLNRHHRRNHPKAQA